MRGVVQATKRGRKQRNILRIYLESIMMDNVHGKIPKRFQMELAPVRVETASLVAIDPGKDTGYCALDERGLVVECGLGVPSIFSEKTIIEYPTVYWKSKADPNSLLVLATRVGRILEKSSVFSRHVALVEPRVWKGSIPKSVHHKRLKKILNLQEEFIVNEEVKKYATSKRHNIWDAVGLAKWAHIHIEAFNI